MKRFAKILYTVTCLIIIGAVLVSLNIFRDLVVGKQSILHNNTLHEELKNKQKELAELNQTRTKLSREIRLLKSDPSYVEKIIRQRLNYVKPDEILYLFDNNNTDTSGNEASK